MKIVWTRRAANQFEEKAARIELEHPRSAAEWIARINSAIQQLSRFPLRGHSLHELTGEPVRALTVGAHRIIYRVDERRVKVLSIKHSREDLSPDDLRPDYP